MHLFYWNSTYLVLRSEKLLTLYVWHQAVHFILLELYLSSVTYWKVAYFYRVAPSCAFYFTGIYRKDSCFYRAAPNCALYFLGTLLGYRTTRITYDLN